MSKRKTIALHIIVIVIILFFFEMKLSVIGLIFAALLTFYNGDVAEEREKYKKELAELRKHPKKESEKETAYL